MKNNLGKDLFSDPVGWARRVSGTKFSLLFTIVCHFLFCALLAILAEPVTVAIWLFLIGGIFPGLYLFAMHKLIGELDKSKKG